MMRGGGHADAKCMGHIAYAKLFTVLESVEDFESVPIRDGGEQYPDFLKLFIIRHRSTNALHHVFLEARNIAQIGGRDDGKNGLRLLIHTHV